MKQKVIGLWMYRNDGGAAIHTRLKNELENRNIKVITDFDMRECYCLNGRVYTSDGVDLSSVDTFYHMNADEGTAYQESILRALELSGVKVINGWASYSLARNKFMTNVILKKNGINVPPSLFVNPKQSKKLAEKIFKDWKAIVVKPVSSQGGNGIIGFNTEEQFRDFIEATEEVMDSYYIEKRINFDSNDYRVEIFNNNVVCSYSRSKRHSFKTNVASGGCFISSTPSREYEKIALKSAKVINIDTTIVDMIKSKDDGKIYVLEVNHIMGLFIESAIKNSKRYGSETIYPSFAFDDKKLGLLTDYLSKY